MIGRACLVGFLAACSGAMSPGLAQDAFFDEGNRLYQADDFQRAARAYEQVLTAGFESGVVYYNLGNAYFKLGELGLAVLNYERATRLLTGDDDVRANLDLARSLTTDDITALPTFLPFAVIRWWVDLFPYPLLQIVVAAAYLIAFGGVVIVVLRRGSLLALWAGRTAIGCGAIVIVLGINLFVREAGVGQAAEAVVLAEAASVQSAPADDADLQLFTIHEGTKVRLDQRGDDWVEVVLEDGRVGWVRAEVLEEI